MWCLEGNIHIQAQHLSRGTRSHSQCRVSVNDGSYRLEIRPRIVHKKQPLIWATGSGLVCTKANTSVPTLFPLTARSLCIKNRCLPPRLVNTERVCQPSLEPNRPCPGKGSVPTSQESSSSTTMESTTLVPNPLGNSDRLSIPSIPASNHSASSNTRAPTSCVKHLRKTYRNQTLSDQATNCSLNHGDQKPISLTTHSWGNGITGVVSRVQIPFRHYK